MPGKKTGLVKGLARGYGAYLHGPALLKKHQMWRWLWMPALLSLSLSVGILAVLFLGFDNFHGWLDAKIELETQWLDKSISWSLAILSVIAAVAAFVFLQKHLVLVLLAPFLGLLAEVMVRKIEGESFEQRLRPVDSIVRSARVNTRSIFLEILAVAGFFFLGLVIPVVGSLVSSAAVLLVQNYFLGNGLLDFPLEYRGRSVKESIMFSRRHRGEATGLGLGYFLTMLVPVLGWMFAPMLGTVAGTVLALDLLEAEGGDAEEVEL
jgi:CysZ protein